MSRRLLAALPLLVAAAVYGYVVRLPFFLDDVPHFQLIDTLGSAGAFWQGSAAFPFYRPIMFTVWTGSRALAGGFDPFALHTLNLCVYALTAVLLGRIGARLGGTLAGVVAGVGFALYPLNYNAVTLVGALGHLGLAFGTALCLYAALLWADGKRSACVACWMGAFLAVFSHEYGVLLLPLLVGALVAAKGTAGLRRALLPLGLPVALLTAVYLSVWLTIPREAGVTLRPDTFLASLATLGQGIVYPLSALLRSLLRPIFPSGDLAVLLLAFGVPLVGWALLRFDLRAGFGLAWYTAAAALPALLLPGDYVGGSPRLALFPGMGALLFWGVALAALWRRRAVWARAAVAVWLALALFVALQFLAAQRDAYLRMSSYTWALLRQMRALQSPALLLVNPPYYVAPLEDRRTFLRGAEGALFMADYVPYNGLYWIHYGAPHAPVDVLTYPDLKRFSGEAIYTPPPELSAAPLADRVRAAQHVIVTRFDGTRFAPVYVGGAGLPVPDGTRITFGDTVMLTGAHAVYDPAAGTVTVTTGWRVQTPAAVRPFVQALCDGVLVGQWDGAVWGETYPFALWQAGEAHADVRTLSLAGVSSLCRLRVLVGVYRESDGVRLVACDASGAPLADDALVVVPVP